MAKIPVGATIAHAYRFAFTNFLAIVGISWLPWLIMMAGFYLLRDTMTALNLANATKNFALMQGKWGQLALFYLAMLVLITMQMTGLTQFALGRLAGPRWVYFSLGKPVWRMIGGILLAILSLIAVTLAYILVTFLLGLALRVALPPPPKGAAILALLAALAFLVGYLALIYAIFRFFFLLAPTIIAEERVGLFRAWSLTYKNFWRIFLVVLALLLPIMILEVGGMFLLAGPMPLIPAGRAPEQLLAFQQAQIQWNLTLTSRMQALWYLLYPVLALASVVFYGASSAAQAFAYRALTSAPVAGDGLPD